MPIEVWDICKLIRCSHRMPRNVHRTATSSSSRDKHVDHQQLTSRPLSALYGQLPLSFLGSGRGEIWERALLGVDYASEQHHYSNIYALGAEISVSCIPVSRPHQLRRRCLPAVCHRRQNVSCSSAIHDSSTRSQAYSSTQRTDGAAFFCDGPGNNLPPCRLHPKCA